MLHLTGLALAIAFAPVCLAQETVVEVKAPPRRVISVDEYKALLDSWKKFYAQTDPVDCCGQPEDMKDEIFVNENGAEFRVPTAFLKEKPDSDHIDERDADKPDPLKAAEQKKKLAVERHAQILIFLSMLRKDADIPEQPFDKNRVMSAQSMAEAVLSDREFRLVKAPNTERTFWERNWKRFIDWLEPYLKKMGSRLPDLRIVSQTLLWLVLGLAIFLAGYLVKRWLEREEAEEFRWRLGSAPGHISSKSWRVWMDEAAEASRAGDWRQAVRLSYWAAISALESSGAWKPDRARTPREYLTLLSATHAHRPALNAMTQEFERVWYAQVPANEDDYQQMLQALERIGCR